MRETVIIEYVNETCVTCGCIFGIPKDMHTVSIKGNKQSFYCPSGHSMSYTESTAERLRKQLAAKELLISQKDREIATLKAPKPKRTYKKRAPKKD